MLRDSFEQPQFSPMLMRGSQQYHLNVANYTTRKGCNSLSRGKMLKKSLDSSIQVSKPRNNCLKVLSSQ